MIKMPLGILLYDESRHIQWVNPYLQLYLGDKDAIGKIDVFTTRSYVAIARAQADKALARLRDGRIKGRRFRVARV